MAGPSHILRTTMLVNFTSTTPNKYIGLAVPECEHHYEETDRKVKIVKSTEVQTLGVNNIRENFNYATQLIL